ncbi:biopolymer transporter ExbD [Mariprofundus sp. EBB-1]|uniref:ExbD/TolR family protein n=1 Tax=Mariprofundus sp. EBB-1 TaxID=2650971 RepID=UPI000EF1A4FA|nr:biopolymer transporter ExbD [Mariprofundus sp. EBB-1]RLL52856.1 biopolymer transporter ExbD [Mariprofundus sp. EBB-1]
MILRPKKRIDYLVDITPLVDVVFLMLIFFMVSTTFNVSSSLKLDLPSSKATVQQKEIKQITVSIDAKGGFYIEDKLVADADLRKRILSLSKGDPNMRVVLRADAETHHKRVVFVLDTLRGLHMSKIGIATVAPAEGEN